MTGQISPAVVLELTVKQAKKLSDILTFCCEDEGPKGAGWKSEELEQLIAIVDKAISIRDDLPVESARFPHKTCKTPGLCHYEGFCHDPWNCVA